LPDISNKYKLVRYLGSGANDEARLATNTNGEKKDYNFSEFNEYHLFRKYVDRVMLDLEEKINTFSPRQKKLMHVAKIISRAIKKR